MAKNRIGELRREHGMNQKELGIRLGVGQTTVSAWETGKNEPDNEAMHKMAEIFRVSIGYLAGYENGYVDGIFTKGLTQERIRRYMDEDEREKLIEEVLRSEEERHDLSEKEIEELDRQWLLERWEKTDKSMYLEAFEINLMCDQMSAEDRKRMLQIVRLAFPNV